MPLFRAHNGHHLIRPCHDLCPILIEFKKFVFQIFSFLKDYLFRKEIFSSQCRMWSHLLYMLNIQFRFPELITALHLRCVFSMFLNRKAMSALPCQHAHWCTLPINHFGLDLITGSFRMSVCLTSGGSVFIIINYKAPVSFNSFEFIWVSMVHSTKLKRMCTKG